MIKYECDFCKKIYMADTIYHLDKLLATPDYTPKHICSCCLSDLKRQKEHANKGITECKAEFVRMDARGPIYRCQKCNSTFNIWDTDGNHKDNDTYYTYCPNCHVTLEIIRREY